MRFFARRYRCVAYNARGYPPSDVPDDVEKYSQARARDDVVAVLDHLRSTRRTSSACRWAASRPCTSASRIPHRARSLVVAGCGYGAQPGEEEKFRAEVRGRGAGVRQPRARRRPRAKYGDGPTRVQFQNKDPRGWREFVEQLKEHSAKGSALTLRGVQKRRPLLHQLVDGMKKIDVPTLVMTGDEDEPCLEASLLMKRSIPTAGLAILPCSGPHDQHRGAGGVQPRGRRLPRRGRGRPLAAARSAGGPGRQHPRVRQEIGGGGGSQARRQDRPHHRRLEGHRARVRARVRARRLQPPSRVARPGTPRGRTRAGPRGARRRRRAARRGSARERRRQAHRGRRGAAPTSW